MLIVILRANIKNIIQKICERKDKGISIVENIYLIWKKGIVEKERNEKQGI